MGGGVMVREGGNISSWILLAKSHCFDCHLLGGGEGDMTLTQQGW